MQESEGPEVVQNCTFQSPPWQRPPASKLDQQRVALAAGEGPSCAAKKWEWHKMVGKETKSSVAQPEKVRVQPAFHASQETGPSMSSKGLRLSEDPKLGRRALLEVPRWSQIRRQTKCPRDSMEHS